MHLLSYQACAELIKTRYKDFSIQPKAEHVNMYSDIYQLTYNHAAIDIDAYKEWINRLNLPESATFLEIFAGAATDSILLSKIYPNHTFMAFDIDDSYVMVREDNITTVLGDAFDINSLPENSHDVLFISDNNKSLCEVRSLEQLENFTTLCGKAARKYVGISFVEREGMEKLDVEVDNYVLKYPTAGKYKDLFAEWGYVLIYDEETQEHVHHDILNLYEDEAHTNCVKTFYQAGYRVKGWSIDTIEYFMKKAGFKTMEKVSDSYLLFQK